jgi:hypothetical protein
LAFFLLFCPKKVVFSCEGVPEWYYNGITQSAPSLL